MPAAAKNMLASLWVFWERMALHFPEDPESLHWARGRRKGRCQEEPDGAGHTSHESQRGPWPGLHLLSVSLCYWPPNGLVNIVAIVTVGRFCMCSPAYTSHQC